MTPRTAELLPAQADPRARRVVDMVDQVRRFGRGMLKLAVEERALPWLTWRERISARFTTRLAEVPTVRA